jgi:translation initiation factor 2 subunit 1
MIDPTQIGGQTRFYEKEFPDGEDLVVVNVKLIAEMGAYVQLLEYNNIEGMILLSELSRRRIRSINRLLRVGHDEVVMVIRVDKEKGYIDLSKRRASPEDIVKAEERYTKAKAVHSIMRHLSTKLRVPMLALYTRIGWPLYKKYGHAFDALQVAVSDPDSIFKGMDMTEAELTELTSFVKLKMAPQPLRIRADIQVTCVAFEGVEAIRAALLTAESFGDDKVPIKVQLIAPPLYLILATTLDKVSGMERMNAAVASVKAEIEKRGGQLVVKMAPTVMSSRDDTELQRMLAELEFANAEISGDEDSDEDSESSGSDGEGSGKEEATTSAAGAGAGGKRK